MVMPARTEAAGVTHLRVLIVSGDRIVREWARYRLCEQGADVTDAADVVTAVRELRTGRPGAVLVDPDSFVVDIVSLVCSFVDANRATPVVILTSVCDGRTVSEALRCGARGFISKRTTGIDLTAAIGTAVSGGLAIDQHTLRALVDADATRGRPSSPQYRATVAARPVRLSRREKGVIELVAQGLTNQQVGAQMHLSPHTVKKYLRNAADKLDAATRLDVVMEATRLGLIELPPSRSRYSASDSAEA